jgi:hypothetical protein
MLKKSKLYIMIERIIKEESEAETVQITNIKKNVMGTISFDMKTKDMRKAQDFIVYPMESASDKVAIQSDGRFGYILFNKNGILMSAKNKVNANSWSFQSGPKATYTLTSSQMNQLKSAIKGTAGDSVGTHGVSSNNSGAGNL